MHVLMESLQLFPQNFSYGFQMGRGIGTYRNFSFVRYNEGLCIALQEQLLLLGYSYAKKFFSQLSVLQSFLKCKLIKIGIKRLSKSSNRIQNFLRNIYLSIIAVVCLDIKE